jgi:hypothetical protein
MAGVFLAAMATLMYQVLLTRIFSVSMWYHFGFIAISVTMFGMTVGALLVYLAPRAFPDQALDSRLTQSSLVFAVSVVFSLLAHLSIPFMTRPSAVHMFGIGLTYLALAVPFTASGICLTLALTRVPARVGAIYAADLVGAGLGCIAVVGLLEIVDGPSAVILVGAIAALGSLCFALRSGRALVLTGAAVAVLFAAWGALNARLVERQHPLGVRLVWVKGRLETPPIWERWNSFSRLAVWPWTDQPFGWGLSDRWPPDRRVEQLLLNIDASAATVLTRYSGERSQIEHLAYDISNTAHHLRPGSHVLVVGVGGGHDILSALLFEQPRITGVELNGEILDGVNRRFGDYTGQLDRQPGVTLVNDEARSFIARSREQYDIVQVTLIDTWAATASGAFVLSENALYTVEAWARMLDRLSPRGILTFSRFYFKTQPAEVYRLASLAAAALARRGVDAPRGHIVIVRKMRDLDNPDEPNGVGTILVSPQPFTAGDLARVETLCAELGFERVLTPDFALDATFAALASDDPAEARRAQQAAALDITPPTDDRPFFFHMLRLRDFLRRDLWNASMLDFNLKAIFVLAVLLATVLVLTSLCIVVPLWLTRRRVRLEGQAPLFVYFIGIGFGFMLIEIAMMQRLNIFLGHPIYGMTVVLFCLLLASGAGSALSQRFVSDVRQGAAAPAVLGALVGVVTIAMLGSAPLFALFEPAATPFRIAVAALLLVPLGLVMGTAFPLGLRLAADRAEALAPWLWGLNGASSVCASVVVVAISLTAGITMAFAAGAACYVAAGLAFVRARAS